MKKSILSPLCSGLVIPGLGQIINGDLKKGAALLFGAFILWMGGIVQFYLMITSGAITTQARVQGHGAQVNQPEPDFTWIRVLVCVYGLIWLYSVLNAFLTGRSLDLSARGGDS